MKPRILFHVGMGKTGTTSLQYTLDRSADILRTQKAHYLGMWFELLGPAYGGYPGLMKLSNESDTTKAQLADVYAASLIQHSRENGIDTYIHSNESIFERPEKLAPFLQKLQNQFDISIYIYMRAPQQWLPSAFTQWGVRHKTQEGKVPDFAPMAEHLIASYDAIYAWETHFGPNLHVRPFYKGIEIVSNFETAIDLRFEKLDARILERGEPADILLRGLFNDRYQQPILPAAFDKAMLKGAQSPVPSVDKMSNTCFRHDGIDTIIASKQATFDYIKTQYGMDLLAEGAQETQSDKAVSPERLIDFLVELTLSQGIRIARLEDTVAELSKRS